ncbi:MAG: PRD domain-containing protein [Faecalibacterium prausnitzii]|nr:PRD domain-containing protein [Faecalibacterium prausnitzii]MDY2681219.1 PRD domain-containing protein [Faecalibacterium prausnitzii]
MELFKKINNNVALARDAKGREMVVFGKGIGFPAMPYELTDLSLVQRSFYDVNEKYFDLLRDVPEAVFLAADDIADTAREELGCSLNTNLTYALADHLNFAIQCSREGMSVRTPLAYDIRHLYPQEYAIAKEGLHQLCSTLEVDLPESEAVSIAMHIITAENEVGDMHSTILTAKVISEISALVEESLSVKLDKDSFSFSRFAMHLRYLVQRMMQGKPLNSDSAMDVMFTTMRREYPDTYTCVQQIDRFLRDTYGWTCSREEQLYLIMHIHRVCVERSTT